MGASHRWSQCAHLYYFGRRRLRPGCNANGQFLLDLNNQSNAKDSKAQHRLKSNQEPLDIDRLESKLESNLHDKPKVIRQSPESAATINHVRGAMQV